MKHSLLFLTLLTLAASLLLSSCRHSDDEPEPEKGRTVLVYMVADNTLGSSGFDSEDLSEMHRAALEGHLGTGRLMVYHHGYNSTPVLMEISATGETELLTYSTDIYSTSPERMHEVIADVKRLAPADSYGMIFWSHADGWLNGASPSDNRYRAFGDDRSHYMKLSTLADVLDDYRFDFLYFDCCLMGNIETVWALRNATPYIISSATELSVHGMPYHQTLQHLFKPEAAVVEAAYTTYKYYADRDNSSSSGCQMSVVATEALPALAEASKALLCRLTKWPANLSNVQSLSVPGKAVYHVDLASFYHRMAVEADALDEYAAWEQALAEAVPAAFTTDYGIGALRVAEFCGLATFPATSTASLTTRGYNASAWYGEVLSQVPLFAL